MDEAIEQGERAAVTGRSSASESKEEDLARTRTRAQIQIDRDRAVATLLRQISSGLSAYRLFPGDVEQPTFVRAVERVRVAAEEVLPGGPVEAEIHGSQFVTERGPVATDDRIERLALACYEHRAERLEVRGVPDAHDLAALYEALSRPPGEETEGGSMAAALRVAGVRSISISELAPAPSGDDYGHGAPTMQQREVWEQLSHPEEMAARLLAEGLPRTIREAAEVLFDRLKVMVGSLTPRQVNAFELYERLQVVVASFPPPLRRGLTAILLERVHEEPLAERLIGTMTDAGLARVLVDLGRAGGPDPVEAALALVRGGIRRDDLVELTTSLLLGREEAGTIMARLDSVGIVPEERAADTRGPGAEPAALPESPVVKTLSNLLAHGVLSKGQDDVRAIRESFPVAMIDVEAIAFEALADYLRIEEDVDRFGEVMGVWVSDATATLRRRDEDHLDRLVRTLQTVLGDGVDGPKGDVVEASIRRVLGRDVLGDLIVSADGESAVESNVRLLRRFGEAAVEGLFDDLAREQDRGRRAQLLVVLAQVARGHQDCVARRLKDERWYVARNAVTVLARSGGPEAVPLLIEASHHHEPAVRREAIHGLVAIAGLEAREALLRAAADRDPSVRSTVVGALRGLATPEACRALADAVPSLPNKGEQRNALAALAGHPAAQAIEALEAFAGSMPGRRLPWGLRRYAKSLLKERKERGR